MVNNCIPQKRNVCISCEKCVRKELFCVLGMNQLLVGLKINERGEEEETASSAAVVEFPSVAFIPTRPQTRNDSLLLNDHHNLSPAIREPPNAYT